MEMPRAKRYLTEADLMDLDDDSCRHELVAGVIVAEPFPTPYEGPTCRSSPASDSKASTTHGSFPGHRTLP